jgi:hypothetical protein
MCGLQSLTDTIAAFRPMCTEVGCIVAPGIPRCAAVCAATLRSVPAAAPPGQSADGLLLPKFLSRNRISRHALPVSEPVPQHTSAAMRTDVNYMASRQRSVKFFRPDTFFCRSQED